MPIVKSGEFAGELQMVHSGLVLYTAYALIGLGTFVVSRMLMAEQESRAAQENLAENKNRQTKNFILKITRPFFTQYVVPVVRSKPFWDEHRTKSKRKIISGGLRDELTPDEFISFKLFLIVFFPLVFGLLNALGLIDIAWYFSLLSGILGWFYPDLWVRSRVVYRQRLILRSMPFIVDLLALSTEAGLDFVGAIGRVVEKAKPSPLVEEFDQLLREIKLGSSRQEALREMGERIDMTEVNSFVAILISADQMGASIGKILRQQSDQIRSQRILRAEKMGAQAATKVIMVTMFVIVPAVFIMIMGPYVVSFVSTGAF